MPNSRATRLMPSPDCPSDRSTAIAAFTIALRVNVEPLGRAMRNN